MCILYSYLWSNATFRVTLHHKLKADVTKTCYRLACTSKLINSRLYNNYCCTNKGQTEGVVVRLRHPGRSTNGSPVNFGQKVDERRKQISLIFRYGQFDLKSPQRRINNLQQVLEPLWPKNDFMPTIWQ